MNRPLLALVAALSASAAFTLAGSGCDPCDCPDTPPRPEANGPYTWLSVIAYGPDGELTEYPVQPEEGSLEITGEKLIVSYEQADTQHVVTYRIVGPR